MEENIQAALAWLRECYPNFSDQAAALERKHPGSSRPELGSDAGRCPLCGAAVKRDPASRAVRRRGRRGRYRDGCEWHRVWRRSGMAGD